MGKLPSVQRQLSVPNGERSRGAGKQFYIFHIILDGHNFEPHKPKGILINFHCEVFIKKVSGL
jgi:hypothetical protein